MDNNKNMWPSPEELNDGNSVDKAPYGVLSEIAEAVYNVYDKKIWGILTARFTEQSNGDRTNFIYSLYLSKVHKKDAAQIKILEIDVADDGWYPATVNLFRPYRDVIGKAENESQFRTFLMNALNSEFVKGNLSELLKEKSM